jgi:hypothetical protein
MVTNQFTIYTSSDPSGPGPITGTTGSLLTVLDACLVNGYTGKTAAGWTKPFANSGSVYGAYTQGTGSGFTLFVNDLNANFASPGKEAALTGWEVLSQIGPTGTGSLHAGVGLNQFPLPAQSLTNGHVTVRKSVSADTTPRPWMLAADGATLYMWILTGDGTYAYYHWSFGDNFSLAGTGDKWNCYIYGRPIDNSGATGGYNDYTEYIMGTSNQLNVGWPAHYIARTGFGGGQSIQFNRRGDSTFSSATANISGWPTPLYGNLSCPIIDGTYYLCPLWLAELTPNSWALRGRFRGLYHTSHNYTNFSDGQQISGSNDYAGKIFTVIRGSNINSVWFLETSPTLEFN